MNRTSIALAAGLCAFAVPAAASAASLTVIVEGVARPGGAIRLALAASEAAYADRAPSFRTLAAPAVAPATRIEISDLPPGRYAFRVFHDANGNGRLDTGAMGRPTEGWSASNGAAGAFGPGPWSRAAFEVRPGAQAVTVRLR